MSILTIAATAYLGICLLLYVNQRGMMYLPAPEIETEEAEAIWLKSGQEKVKLWRVGQGDARP